MRKLFILVMLIGAAFVCADDYIDDIYYSPSMDTRKSSEPQPNYKNGMKEIIFIEDDSTQSADTVSQSQPDSLHSKPTTVKAIVK